MQEQIRESQLLLTLPHMRQEWEQLLTVVGILDTSHEHGALDYTLGLYDKDCLIATGSSSGSLIKYVAIHPDYRLDGATFNRLMSRLLERMMSMGHYHQLVVTKKKYEVAFQSIGFDTLVSVNEAVMMEAGISTLTSFFGTSHQKDGHDIAGIVMNAHPFTKGHRFLIEQASLRCDWVYVFVLSEEQRLFTSQERLNLVKEGTSDLPNVEVLSGGDYVISPSTFPVYFLKKEDKQTLFQARLDATLFLEKIAPLFRINVRYVGTEPHCMLTKEYNRVLHDVLEPDVRVIEIPRQTTDEGEIISASKVRKLMELKEVAHIRTFVPKPTYDLIRKKIGESEAT